MAGRFSSVNCTSTTGPMICTILPTFIDAFSSTGFVLSDIPAAEAAHLGAGLDPLRAERALPRLVAGARGVRPLAPAILGCARTGRRPARIVPRPVAAPLLALENRLFHLHRPRHAFDRGGAGLRGGLDV